MISLGEVNLQGDSITTASRRLKVHKLQRWSIAGMSNPANYKPRYQVQLVQSSQRVHRSEVHKFLTDSPSGKFPKVFRTKISYTFIVSF
jgi:hypothetical protein